MQNDSHYFYLLRGDAEFLDHKKMMLIKVGRSRNVRNRIKSLSQQCPCYWKKCYCVAETDFRIGRLEGFWKAALSKWRTRNDLEEFFWAPREVREAIRFLTPRLIDAMIFNRTLTGAEWLDYTKYWVSGTDIVRDLSRYQTGMGLAFDRD